MTERETFSVALRRIRVNRKLSLPVMAKKVGVSERTIRNWEKGRTRPRELHFGFDKIDPILNKILAVELKERRDAQEAAAIAARFPSKNEVPPQVEPSQGHDDVKKRAIRLASMARIIENDDDVIRLLREAAKADMTAEDLLVLLGARSE